MSWPARPNDSRRLRLPSLRVRLTLWSVALLALILGGLSVAVYVSLARSLDAELDRLLTDEARQASGVAQIATTTAELREEFRRLNVGTVVALYDDTGQHLLAGRSVSGPGGSALPVPTGPSKPRTETLADGSDWRVLTMGVPGNGGPDRLLEVARAERDNEVALRELLIMLLLAIPLGLVLAVAGGLFLAGRALGPIGRITRMAEEISAEDLSRRLGAIGGDDEIGRLAGTFDRMLERLDDAFRRQRQFTADASHELRTPLTMLVSQADVVLERTRTQAEYRRVVRSMRDDARRMAQLVGELLTLARADAGEDIVLREPLDFAALAGEVVAALAPVAQARNVALELVPGRSVELQGDQTRLTQLVVNLVDNSIKYTPAGGQVLVSVDRAESDAVLRVADTGIGIAPEHHGRVFERFYRVDPSRSRDEGGAGLGLALCRWIARAHGGDVTVESEPGVGSVFTARLGGVVSQSAPPERVPERQSGHVPSPTLADLPT